MLQFDGISWKVSEFGKDAILLEPQIQDGHLEFIHRLFHTLATHNDPAITDIIPAYKSVALFYSTTKQSLFELLESVDRVELETSPKKVIEVEVDYSQGLDWESVSEQIGLSKSEIIDRHSKPVYTVAMIGFIPGFIFLEGMESELFVPRLETPRTKVPAGSIGIGGKQTGIYSLESPGGWNIIGKTTQRFFDAGNEPPISISPGDKLRFKPV